MTPESIAPLIHRHLDGTATPEEASRLALALLDEPEVARAFADATRLEAGLRACFRSEAVGRRLGKTVRFEALQRRRPVRRGWAAAAAAAALAVAGLSLAWWRPWGRTVAPVVAEENRPATARTVTDVPPPPPSLRRAGALSPAAAEVKWLASRYWLPDAIEFSGTPLAEAVAVVQQRAASVNHRHNSLIAGFAIDVPEDLAEAPVSAVRADLPLSAWLDILSAQVGCELRFTENGAAFDPVDQPDRIETRRFPLPSIADASAPTETPARLFSYSRPWDEEPEFRSVPAHGTTLAAAWGIPMQESARVVVKEGDTLEVRHTRRELRRIEGLLAAATADAGRPTIAFRTRDVPLPAAAAPVATGVTSEVATEMQNQYWIPSGIYLPALGTSSAAMGNRIVSNDEAAVMLAQSPPFSGMTHAEIFARGYRDGIIMASQETDAQGTGIPVAGSADIKLPVDRIQQGRFFLTTKSSAPEVTVSGIPRLAVAEEESEIADPWQQTVRTTARLGETVHVTTGAAPTARFDRDLLTVGFSLLDMQPKPLTAVARLEGELIKLTGAYTPTDGGSPTDFQAYVGEGQAFILQTEDAPPAAGEPMPMGSGIVWGSEPAGAGSGRLAPHEGVHAGRAVVVQFDDGDPPLALQPEFAATTNGVVTDGVVFRDDAAPWEQVTEDQRGGISFTWGEGQPDHTSWWYKATSLGPAPSVLGVVISPVLEWPSVTASRR